MKQLGGGSAELAKSPRLQSSGRHRPEGLFSSTYPDSNRVVHHQIKTEYISARAAQSSDGFFFKVHLSGDSVRLVETGREKGAMWSQAGVVGLLPVFIIDLFILLPL